MICEKKTNATLLSLTNIEQFKTNYTIFIEQFKTNYTNSAALIKARALCMVSSHSDCGTES
jgi:hypothetical protein